MAGYADEDFDGVQYDTFYGSSPMQDEAEQIRRECAEQELRASRDTVIVTRQY